MNAAASKKPTLDDIVAETCALVVRDEGTVTREKIVELAAKKSHPLHPFFEWDDTKAAHEHRLERAYQLIRRWDQIKTYKNPAAPALVQSIRLRALLPTGTGVPFEMAPRAIILDDKEMRKAFIERKLAELYGWCHSVADVKELTELRSTIAKGIQKLED